MRRRVGLSQAELARRLSFSQQTISSWECGRRRILPVLSAQLLDVLQIARAQHDELRARVVKEGY